VQEAFMNTPGVTRRLAGVAETVRANRGWWDSAADDYQAEHGAFLRDVGFIWGPEGLDEAVVRLLAPPGGLAGKRVLEVGCGAAQCARWLATEGARVVAFDLSIAQLSHALLLGSRTGVEVPLVQADAERLPFATGSFDLVCSAYGALPFVADAGAVMREVARVLQPSGRWVFSVSHPIRWAFPDDPGPHGLIATMSYFDRRPYVEHGPDGSATYVEHHRTMGDWVRLIRDADLTLVDLVEPEWPDDLNEVWGGWSPTRGRIIPGTAIFATCKRQ
jgi:SAM-dependent methyltransferase